ncbi:hypothetical protein KP77_27590 [Jeotgalibacillus alimentarius]|uniref:SLH domain-containing protein n=1 Tax=Jeotgalibacillus alimentarius TaxID=135826 RepID=A0A0C2VCH0_9BACL|nr:carboxypeptidase regulatory-like domain-containing protein [Jeotgalibacillus alimentarius]KIL46632.1 hypothetical protein KP77_27590 [Jeotgalibacillus alimentarius]
MSVNRKFLAGTVTTALVASAVAPAAAAEEAQYNAQEELFTDVPETNSHFENIYKAVDYGLLSGYPDGTFKPLNALTRSNVVKALGKFVIASEGYSDLADYLADNDLSNVEPFNDVTADSRDSELYNFSLIVKEAGIFQGSNNNLMPSNNITRQQMAQVIVNAFNLDEVETDNEAVVEDLDTAFTSYQDDIQILANLGVTTVSNFRPLDQTSRGHLASFLTAAYEVSIDEDSEELTSGISGFIVEGSEDAPAEGAVVSIGDQEAVTDENGYFELLNVAAGDAEVTISKEGYKTVEKDTTILEDTVTAFSGDLGTAIVTTDISVAGNIVNGDTGADVNGATVSIQGLDEDGEWTNLFTQKDVDGSYTFNNDSNVLELGGEYRLVVEADGFKSYTQDITLDDQNVENTISGIELDEIEEMALTVNVMDADGTEVPATSITIYDTEENETVFNGSDEDATTETFDFESGSYQLVVDAAGFAISNTTFEVVEGADQTVDVELEEGFEVNTTVGTAGVNEVFTTTDSAVKVELLQNGTPVADLDGTDVTVTADTISADFDRVAPGEYSLRVSGDYIVTDTFTGITVTDEDVDFEARAEAAGVIDGTLVDESTNPVNSSVVVNLLDEDGSIVDTIETSNGTYNFTGVSAGTYTVEAVSKTLVNDSIEVTVVKNGDVNEDDAVITLATPATTGTVSGFVREAGSLDAVDGTVAYYNEAGQLAYDTTVASNGSYTVDEVDPGTYDVVVRGDGVDTYTATVTVAAGDNLQRTNYLLENGGDASMEITAVDSEGEAIDLTDADIDLTDAYYATKADEETSVIGSWNEDDAAVTADTITFENLSAGTYDFDLTLGSFVDYEGTATVASGEEAQLEITLEETASQRTVDFKVLDENNADVNDKVKAVIFNEDGTVKEVLADGATSVDLMDGDYTIAFYLDGYAVSTRDFTVDGEDVTIPVVQLVDISN